MREVAVWGLVSAGSLLVIELALGGAKQPAYTHLYRAVRNSNRCVKYLPVAAAAVTFAHLEGWIPDRFDPFSIAARAVRWI